MNKVKKLEKSRFSIVTKDLTLCYICKNQGKETKKDDLHEVYHGKNRINSMKWGCVLPVCRKCHNRIHLDTTRYDTIINGIEYSNITFDEECKIKMQYAFIKTYPEVDFVSIFRKNYI